MRLVTHVRFRAFGAVLAASVVATAIAGCAGDGDAAAPGPKATVTVTETATPLEATDLPEESPPPSSFEPNVGDLALSVGETREGTAFRTTLEEIRFPYPPGQYREPESGNQFLGLRLEQCMRDSAEPTDEYGEPLMSTYPGEWYAATPSGEQLTGGGEWTDWPQPKFPTLVTMNPGECIKGWVTLEVHNGTKVAKIIWRPGRCQAV